MAEPIKKPIKEEPGVLVHTDPKTRETVFTLGDEEFWAVTKSGAEALAAFRAWRKANG